VNDSSAQQTTIISFFHFYAIVRDRLVCVVLKVRSALEALRNALYIYLLAPQRGHQGVRILVCLKNWMTNTHYYIHFIFRQNVSIKRKKYIHTKIYNKQKRKQK